MLCARKRIRRKPNPISTIRPDWQDPARQKNNDRARAPPPSPVVSGGSLFQRGVDVRIGRVERRTHAVYRRDDRKTDSCGNQRVLEGRGGSLVGKKADEQGSQG